MPQSMEKEIATHSSTLDWKIPWMEEHDRLQSMGLQRVGHNRATNTHTNVLIYSILITFSSFALISHASKVMLKILQARLQQYMN